MAFVNAPKELAFDNVSAAAGAVTFRDSASMSLAVWFLESKEEANLKLRGSFDDSGNILSLSSVAYTVADGRVGVTFDELLPPTSFDWGGPTVRVDRLWQALLSGDDVAVLGDRADRVNLGKGNDFVSAGAGDDTLWGGAGADVLRGADGVDTAAWDYAAANYSLALEPGATRVADRTGSDGVDTLFDIERLRFADRTVMLDTRAHGSYADIPAEVYQFFIVAFNAAPGVVYMDQLAGAYRWWTSDAGRVPDPIRTLVEVFTTKQQFTDVYPLTLSNHDLAVELVNQIVKQSADGNAKAQAVGDVEWCLDNGWTRGQVIYQVFGNLAKKDPHDPTWGGTSRQFFNEIEVAKYYTEVLNQANEDLQTLRDAIHPVGPDTDVGTTELIAQLIGVGLMGG